MMKFFEVVFGSEKEAKDPRRKRYHYKSELPLQVGCQYVISSDTRTYDTPVTVLFRTDQPNVFDATVTITKAHPVKEIPVPDFRIKVVSFNKEKKVTAVRWNDGSVTKVKCSDMDPFDEEKALALCYMKRWCFDNRGCFNEALKKYCNKEGE